MSAATGSLRVRYAGTWHKACERNIGLVWYQRTIPTSADGYKVDRNL